MHNISTILRRRLDPISITTNNNNIYHNEYKCKIPLPFVLKDKNAIPIDPIDLMQFLV